MLLKFHWGWSIFVRALVCKASSRCFLCQSLFGNHLIISPQQAAEHFRAGPGLIFPFPNQKPTFTLRSSAGFSKDVICVGVTTPKNQPGCLGGEN
jgi:hypothetical protein